MFTETNREKVLRVFLREPHTWFHLREIARLTKLSPAGASKIIKQLEKEGMIIKKQSKVTVDYIANIENKNLLTLKKTYNLHLLYNSSLVDYLDKSYSPEAIIIFGSYARAEDWEKSDIDIAVITSKSKDLNLTKFEKILGRKINIHETTLKKASLEFKNNLANGIVLKGYLRLL